MFSRVVNLARWRPDDRRHRSMARRTAGYGWIPDLPDQRDLLYAAPPAPPIPLPAQTDLRAQCPPVYDQGQLGSCTANAIAGALQFDEAKQGEADTTLLSRLFIYYNERVMEGTVGTDSGAMIRDGIKTVNAVGACPESEWPYDIARFTEKPSDACCADAGPRRAGDRWPRGHGRRLRRHRRNVLGAQLVGDRLGAGRLFHHAVRLPERPQPIERLLDHPADVLTRLRLGPSSGVIGSWAA